MTERARTPVGFADGDYGQLLEEFRSGQELLREAEVRFKLLVETIPGVAYIAEPGEHGAWLYISPRLEAAARIRPRAVDRRADLLDRADAPRRPRAGARWTRQGWTETTGGVHVGEYRLRASDGRYRWIRDAATARPGGQLGDKAVWFGVLTDITESRDAQEALRHSEQLLRSVLETAQDAFVAVDGTGAVLEWNRRAETMFGRRREDVLGARLTELVVPQRLRAAEPLRARRGLRRPQPRTSSARHWR